MDLGIRIFVQYRRMKGIVALIYIPGKVMYADQIWCKKFKEKLYILEKDGKERKECLRLMVYRIVDRFVHIILSNNKQ